MIFTAQLNSSGLTLAVLVGCVFGAKCPLCLFMHGRASFEDIYLFLHRPTCGVPCRCSVCTWLFRESLFSSVLRVSTVCAWGPKRLCACMRGGLCVPRGEMNRGPAVKVSGFNRTAPSGFLFRRRLQTGSWGTRRAAAVRGRQSGLRNMSLSAMHITHSLPVPPPPPPPGLAGTPPDHYSHHSPTAS